MWHKATYMFENVYGLRALYSVGCTVTRTNFARKTRIELTAEMLQYPAFRRASTLALPVPYSLFPVLKDSEFDGVRYFFEGADQAVVPLMIDI